MHQWNNMDGILMKTIFALILLPALVFADGVVLFEKSTGFLQDRHISQVVTNQDDGVVSTNILRAWSKLQPKETTWSGNRALGAQVLKRVDWSVYDLARYKTVLNDPPVTTADLSDVEPFGVAAQLAEQQGEAASKATIQAAAESNLVALCNGIGYTNRPINWLELDAIGEAITATNKLSGLELQLKVMKLYNFYKDNGGDSRKAGKKK